MSSMTSEASLATNVAAMGQALGEVYSALWQEVARLCRAPSNPCRASLHCFEGLSVDLTQVDPADHDFDEDG